MIAVTFEKSQGIKVNMTLKGSGEAVAQLMAEKANPKTDIFFGGTGDPHLVAAEQNLTSGIQVAAAAQVVRLGAEARPRSPATRP